MKTYTPSQNSMDITTDIEQPIYDAIARAAELVGLSINQYMTQAALKQALADIYFSDTSLLSLKSQDELAWLQTQLDAKFSDNQILTQKLAQLQEKKHHAGISYKSARRKLFT